MSERPTEHLPGIVPKPAGTIEFSIRAVIVGVVVAAIMGASYPYIVLKLGFGPNVSVVAAFFGYLFLGIAASITGRRSNRWENNIVQTAGSSAAQTAFMCVILAAFDFVGLKGPSQIETFVWLFAASVLGILLAVPLRKHYVEDPDLTFADGVAAAETVIVLDGRGKEARLAAIALFAGTIASAIGWLLTTKWGAHAMNSLFSTDFTEHVIPESVWETMGGLTIPATSAGFAVSLLGIGSGMIVGNRVNISMAVGGILSWIVAGNLLVDHHIIPIQSRREILLWAMWPGTGMLIAAGLTALALKWRTLARTFSTMSTDSISSDEFPLKLVGIGAVLATITLLIAQWVIFDLEPWFTLIAVLLSVPLMLVGLRVLGETNWGPISQLTNVMQATFAALVPGNLTSNLAASGTTGTVAVQSESIIQDYKAGHIIGSTPKFLTYSQLIAAPIGAAAVAISYDLLKDTYGVGAEPGNLSSPISVRIAGFAKVLNEGFDQLPKYALLFLIIGAIVGVLITLGEIKWKKLMPSATGLGIGMMVPGSVVFTMVLGGLIYTLWRWLHPKSAEQTAIPLASGLIAGEAVMAIIIPILILAKVIAP